MGTNYYLVKNKPSVYAGDHIGKSSWGWKFLFYKPDYWEHQRELNTFEQWRDYLKEATDSGKYIIMDEYDKPITFDDFIELVESRQKEEHEDMFKYCENINGYRFTSGEFS